MTQRDEERVIDALRAFTGGLIVTDQDITSAESRLRERLEPPPSRRPLVILAAAVAAVLIVGFFISQARDRDPDSAPPADQPASPADSLVAALQADAYDLSSAAFTAGAQPIAQDVAGFWMLRDPFAAPLFVDSNGNWQIGSLTSPSWYGTSTLSGATWIRRHDDGTGCAQENGRQHFSHSLNAALAQDGSLRLQLVRGLNVCTPAEEREVWDRVRPGSPVGEYLLAMTKDADWQKGPASYRWLGIYVAPATGHVLDVADDGSYRYYDALDDGSLVAGDHGELATTSGTTTASCAGGSISGGTEVVRIPSVDGYVGRYDAVRITSPTGSCTSDLAAQGAWVNVFR